MTGQLFGDRYQVGDTLGFGGMSEVHRGRDLRLGRDVAIKVLRADLARDPSFQVRFRREAQNAASLNHPAIVAVYDTGETTGANGIDKVPYIVMEYVDGETLRDLLKREGTLSPKRAMEIVADVSAALDFSHRHGIVHRDIKPANIMMTRAGAVKVMDFGIARAVADGQSSVTATAAVIGTAQYLSPEQARGEAVDARSDVYSTGCVIYELITGAPPFVGDSPVAVAYQHVREEPKPPSTVKPGLPREMDAIVLKALNKNPLNRYQTAAELRADLVRALSGQAVRAPRVMDDAERTEILGSSRGAPQRVGPGISDTPPILAAPRKYAEQWEDDDEESSRSKKVWGYVGIGAICLALLAGAILLTIRFTSGPGPVAAIAVPDIYGKTAEEAARLLTQNNMQIKVDPTAVPGEDTLKGKVVKQVPSAGTARQPGTVVTVEIGAGVVQVTVPNLTGMSSAQAQSSLEKAGLSADPKKVASATNQLDLVQQGQTPPANTAVAPGTKVSYTVGGGPDLVSFPGGLVGAQQDAVTQKLQSLKLEVKPVLVDDTATVNQVLAVEKYHDGDRVPENTIVTITVSRGNLFVMPDIAATKPTADDARSALQTAGFVGTATLQNQPTGDSSEWGQVIAQDPEPDSKVNKSTGTVTLSVGVVPKFTVPNVGNKTEQEARDAFAQAKYLGTLQFQTAGGLSTPAGLGGKVADQQQADGSPLTPGSSIDANTPILITLYPVPPPPPPPSTPPPSTPPSTPPPSTPSPSGQPNPSSQPSGPGG